MNAKQQLHRERINPYARPDGIVTMALPFYRGFAGTLVHRVRSGKLFRAHRQDRTGHIALTMWCGQGGFIDDRRLRGRTGGGELLAETPEKAIHCATCEGKAIGAGMDGMRTINGRHVLYRART